MKKGRGGGLAEEGELIEVEEVIVSASPLYGIMRFLLNKC